jgi:phosphate transport system permease protein
MMGIGILTAGLILAIMIVPFIASVMRDVFEIVPPVLKESAYALGCTKWEVVRKVVLPYTRIGVVGGVMLGLGRALGETMAVALVLSSGPLIASLIRSGNQTIAAEIALDFPEAFGLRLNELIAAGLVLFLITLLVNMVARWIISRHKEFSGAN